MRRIAIDVLRWRKTVLAINIATRLRQCVDHRAQDISPTSGRANQPVF
jgi:hypothetical protein